MAENLKKTSNLLRSQLFKKKLSPKMILGILGFVLLLVGAGAGYYLTQINQDVRQQAFIGDIDLYDTVGDIVDSVNQIADDLEQDAQNAGLDTSDYISQVSDCVRSGGNTDDCRQAIQNNPDNSGIAVGGCLAGDQTLCNVNNLDLSGTSLDTGDTPSCGTEGQPPCLFGAGGPLLGGGGGTARCITGFVLDSSSNSCTSYANYIADQQQNEEVNRPIINLCTSWGIDRATCESIYPETSTQEDITNDAFCGGQGESACLVENENGIPAPSCDTGYSVSDWGSCTATGTTPAQQIVYRICSQDGGSQTDCETEAFGGRDYLESVQADTVQGCIDRDGDPTACQTFVEHNPEVTNSFTALLCTKHPEDCVAYDTRFILGGVTTNEEIAAANLYEDCLNTSSKASCLSQYNDGEFLETGAIECGRDNAPPCPGETICNSGYQLSGGKCVINTSPNLIGQSCSNSGDCSNTAVCTGGTCSEISLESGFLARGEICADDGQCISGNCYNSTCSSITAGCGRDNNAPCPGETICNSGYQLTGGVCVLNENPNEIGESCTTSGDCANTAYCDQGTKECTGIDLDNFLPTGEACDSDNQCISGNCSSGVCSRLDPGDSCISNTQCASGACIDGSCEAGEDGGACVIDGQCASGACVNGVCGGGSIGGGNLNTNYINCRLTDGELFCDPSDTAACAGISGEGNLNGYYHTDSYSGSGAIRTGTFYPIGPVSQSGETNLTDLITQTCGWVQVDFDTSASAWDGEGTGGCGAVIANLGSDCSAPAPVITEIVEPPAPGPEAEVTVTGGGGTPPSGPPPGVYTCGSSCTSDSQCQQADSRFICSSEYGNTCRLASNPESPQCQPAVGPQCISIDMTNVSNPNAGPTDDPELGDAVNFTCGLVSEADHYIFRVIEPDGTIVDLQATGRTSETYTIDQEGGFAAQCQICTGTADSTCLPYEDPYNQPIP